MSHEAKAWSDERVERIMGNLLRAGVVTAALVVLIGGCLYLVRYGTSPADHRHFHGEPARLRSPIGIVEEAVTVSSRGLIQLGLLLLIATPLCRVIFSVFAFARQRDWTYVVITLVVLVVLAYSLFWGLLTG
jgi:uncharacterized membrane protein